MPVKNRNKAQYKKEYQQQLDRGEGPARKQRYEARKEIDAAGIDRKGKHVAHIKAITNGGGNKGNLKVVSPHANLSFARKSDHRPKK